MPATKIMFLIKKQFQKFTALTAAGQKGQFTNNLVNFLFYFLVFQVYVFWILLLFYSF